MKRKSTESDERKVMITEFIECYRNNRLLWDPNYQHPRKIGARYAKERAYGELAAVMRPFRKNASIEDAKRQINTLRSTYRKECYKVLASEGSDTPYKSGIWWFKLMRFIKYGLKDENESDDNEVSEHLDDDYADDKSTYQMNITIPEQMSTRTKSKQETTTLPKTMHGTPAEESDDCVNYEMLLDDIVDNHCDETNDNGEYNNEYEHTAGGDETDENEIGDDADTDEDDINEQCSYAPSKRRKYEDSFYYLSKIWADKLRKISSKQFVLAEKAINDVLFDAEMGILSHHTSNYVAHEKNIFEERVSD